MEIVDFVLFDVAYTYKYIGDSQNHNLYIRLEVIETNANEIVYKKFVVDVKLVF